MQSFVDHSAAIVAGLGERTDLDGVHLVLEQRIDDPDAAQVWHLRIADGTVEVLDGPAIDPDVTLRQDLATATALQTGTLHAQHAFLTGRLTIDGDIPKLLEHGDLLQELLRGSNA